MQYMIFLLLAVSMVLLAMLLKEKKRQVQKSEECAEKMQDQEEMVRALTDDAEKIRDSIWNYANIIHLYSVLSEEEAKIQSLKQKQIEISKAAEEIMRLTEK